MLAEGTELFNYLASAILRENLTNALVAAQQRHDQGNTHTQDGEEIEGVLEEQAWGLRVR